MNSLTLGPVLGLESGSDGAFYTCLVVTASHEAPVWVVDGQRVPFSILGGLAGGETAWRAEWPLPSARPTSRIVGYALESQGVSIADRTGVIAWKFHVPADPEPIRFVYASCNGFSAAKLMANTSEPHRMWERMHLDHTAEPLSLLVLGGDQIYADAIWEQSWMHDFAEKTDEQMKGADVTPEMEANLDGFYERLYLRQWGAAPVAAMLASVPSIMMWDDHDIFDGWGSHPEELQGCPVYKRIFQSALRAFRLFQLRGNRTRGFLDKTASHHGYVSSLNGETFLMLDHRAERTPTAVMGEGQWAAFKQWLARFTGQRLFVQSAVPVIYRTFGLIERSLAATDKREELEDDLNDHWSAREHQRERLRLIYSLIERQKVLRDAPDSGSHEFRWMLLSGDVHVGCMASVWEKDLNLGLYQVVSSGIVHPPPTLLQWLGICALSADGEDRLGNGELVTEIHQIAGARGRFLRTRNYARLQLETEKVWINWRCENDDDTFFCV